MSETPNPGHSDDSSDSAIPPKALKGILLLVFLMVLLLALPFFFLGWFARELYSPPSSSPIPRAQEVPSVVQDQGRGLPSAEAPDFPDWEGALQERLQDLTEEHFRGLSAYQPPVATGEPQRQTWFIEVPAGGVSEIPVQSLVNDLNDAGFSAVFLPSEDPYSQEQGAVFAISKKPTEINKNEEIVKIKKYFNSEIKFQQTSENKHIKLVIIY